MLRFHLLQESGVVVKNEPRAPVIGQGRAPLANDDECAVVRVCKGETQRSPTVLTLSSDDSSEKKETRELTADEMLKCTPRRAFR